MMKSKTFTDSGLLLIRIMIAGLFMIFHGYTKITGGPQRWESLGKSMAPLGMDFFPAFWGFMAAFSEFIVPIFILAGILFRPSVLLLAFTMLVAMSTHFIKVDSWSKIELPLAYFVLLLALFLTGPGKYSLQYFFDSRRSKTHIATQ